MNDDESSGEIIDSNLALLIRRFTENKFHTATTMTPKIEKRSPPSLAANGSTRVPVPTQVLTILSDVCSNDAPFAAGFSCIVSSEIIPSSLLITLDELVRRGSSSLILFGTL